VIRTGQTLPPWLPADGRINHLKSPLKTPVRRAFLSHIV
jgi:hypothetical protein